MNWINSLLTTYRKGLKYDKLSKELDVSNNALITAHNLLENFKLQSALSISDLHTQFEKLKSQMKDMLAQGILNLAAVKPWYEDKYGRVTWLYDYDGKGRKDVKGALAVSKEGEDELVAFCIDFIEKQNLVDVKNPNTIISKVARYFMSSRQWKYVYDSVQFGKREFWQKADISLKTRKGDCDDLAILMHNVIYYLFQELGISEQTWRLKLTAGGTLVEGHCFNIWLHDDGEWYVLESTLDLKGSFNKTWLKAPIRHNNLYTDFWGFARKDRSWAGMASSLQPYSRGVSS